MWLAWESWLRPAEQSRSITRPRSLLRDLFLWDVPFYLSRKKWNERVKNQAHAQLLKGWNIATFFPYSVCQQFSVPSTFTGGKPRRVLFLYRWLGPECHLMQAWQFAGGRGEGESGELECISGLRQVVHCCNSYLREGGSLRVVVGVSQRTVARKHLWHLDSPLVEMPELTDREAGVKCQSYPPRSLKNVARVSI